MFLRKRLLLQFLKSYPPNGVPGSQNNRLNICDTYKSNKTHFLQYEKGPATHLFFKLVKLCNVGCPLGRQLHKAILDI